MNEAKTPRHKIWLDKAEDDLRYAHGNHDMEFYSQVCFLAHQSAEKALKAYLLSNEVRLEKIRIHAMPQLVKKCIEYDQEFANLRDISQILNRYYIPTRYPPEAGPLGEFDEQQAEEAIEIAEKILSFVKERI